MYNKIKYKFTKSGIRQRSYYHYQAVLIKTESSKKKEHSGFKHVTIEIIDYLDSKQDNATLIMLKDLHIKLLVTLYPI